MSGMALGICALNTGEKWLPSQIYILVEEKRYEKYSVLEITMKTEGKKSGRALKKVRMCRSLKKTSSKTSQSRIASKDVKEVNCGSVNVKINDLSL